MKNIKIIAVLFCLGYFGLCNSYAQSTSDKQDDDKVYKVQMLEVPDSVKETLKNYSGYTISKDVSYKLRSTNTKSDKVYRFKIERKNFPYVLLVSEKGKVLGIESDET
ncbi:hypothetical protein EGM88_06550 [Aureibaculum marinum]|uniref:PepSY domain-containing protein n=1 Tax=Aureibaculum marinum TaxID=2487930 RepID=A0A3N4PH26_9FLAO|nr:hypothetical protein [Aureibaculum marinum]RPD98843.1 hypothetical protein EGM88_06550 [Aureibaculum marinum]